MRSDHWKKKKKKDPSFERRSLEGLPQKERPLEDLHREERSLEDPSFARQSLEARNLVNVSFSFSEIWFPSIPKRVLGAEQVNLSVLKS